MPPIYPYATLSPDATSSFDLHWLHEGPDGISGHSVDFRKKGESTWIPAIEPIIGGLMAASNHKYFYWIRLSGLKSDTIYEAIIRHSEGDVTVEFKTFPKRLFKRTLFGICIQDVHIRRSATGAWNNDVTKMDIVSNDNPEFIIFAGDWITNGADTTSSNADKQVDWVKNFLPRLDCHGRLVPIFYVPGNHEVGNTHWSGTSPSPLSDNPQCNDFCKNKERFEPFDVYYGQIKIGNYINIVGLDTHTQWAETQGDWLDENIDSQTPIGIIHYHNPMFVAGDRGTSGLESWRQGLTASKQWMPAIYDAGNYFLGLSGNIHIRKATYQLKIQETEETNSIELKDGRYLVQANEGERSFVELGEGWTSNRNTLAFWHTRYTQSSREHYYRLWIRKDGYEVEDVDVSTPSSEMFEFPIKRVKFMNSRSINNIGGL